MEFPASIKNSNTHRACYIETSHFVNVTKRARASVLFLVWFDNFALTTGFYWSYTLLPKSPVLMRFCSQIYNVAAHSKMSGFLPQRPNAVDNSSIILDVT